MSAHRHPQAMGGKIFDRFMWLLLVAFCVSWAVVLYRAAAGLGPVSNMTDGFTWGIWEPINVVVFTGVGAGAYGVGLLCYVLNRGEYHGLVRPAVLLGAICYMLGATSVFVSLGRYWNAIWAPLVIPWWNLSSALLEVALCVMTYVAVLWVEVLPAVFERAAAERRYPRLAALGRSWGARLAKVMPFLIALAVVLPTMHQSSLGGLMLIAGPKLHPLWHNALLPTLFLVSCLSMGYGAVVVLTNLLRLAWNAEADQKLFARMSVVNAGLLLLYLVLRLGEVVVSGKLAYLGLNWPTLLFAVELALFAVPAIRFLSPAVQASRGRTFGAALLTIAAGTLYRIDTFMTVYRPAGWDRTGRPYPSGWQYWPSVGESVVTLAAIAFAVAVFVFVSRLFPVVVVAPRAERDGDRAAGGHRSLRSA